MILDAIEIILPAINKQLSSQILQFLSPFGNVEDSAISFAKSNEQYVPTVQLRFEHFSIPFVRFYSNKHPINVELINKTGIEKKSTYTYSHIEMGDFIKRMSGLELTYLDHVGFDLPWFQGIHPELLELRKSLKSKSLYYLFPTGEAWDFIIPGTKEEILGESQIQYSTVRRPKFEIVSLDTDSTPLIQIDFSVNVKYGHLIKLFPESIQDKELKNMWVYINNPYGIDICFVVNEHVEGDWSEFFKKSKL